jgi:hypothetical protein
MVCSNAFRLSVSLERCPCICDQPSGCDGKPQEPVPKLLEGGQFEDFMYCNTKQTVLYKMKLAPGTTSLTHGYLLVTFARTKIKSTGP